MRTGFLIILLALWPWQAVANDRQVVLTADPVLVDSGLFKHILPRFTLKTQVRVTMAEPGDPANLVLGTEGRALFQDDSTVWYLSVATPDHPGTKRFAEWLTSEVGQNTIFGFAPEGVALFVPPEPVETVKEVVEVVGDAALGKTVSQVKCGRCHVTERERGMSGIGSTPSFFVLRSLADWEERFIGFYVLKPHAAFTQIIDVTEPFPENRPSPIAPIELTLDEVDAVLAYVAAIEAADLGAPLDHQ